MSAYVEYFNTIERVRSVGPRVLATSIGHHRDEFIRRRWVVEDGYLTGYPVPDGRYAFARTWPAWDAPRPNCVWTHTLLIDFEDIASIDNVDGLVSMFKRPDAAPYINPSISSVTSCGVFQ